MAANVIINNQVYGPIRNPHAERTAMDHIIEGNRGSYIVYRTLQLMDRVCKAAAMVFESISDFLSGLAGKLSTAWAFLILPRLPEVTKNAWEAIKTWGTVEGPEGYALRGHVKRVHDIADCSASWCYAGSLVLGSTPLKNAGDVFDFGSHTTDLSMAAEDHSMAGKHLEHIQANHANNQALIERFAETKKEALLRMIKSIASVVSGALGLLVLAFGGPVLPAAALLAISTAATVFALIAHFYKETATYKPVKFFEWSGNMMDGVRVN
ncbi:MAG: hypothetical protein K1X28_08470 [Parachlamydiales bacterium]|nr:hypothetical protein [Parachlamydiales bacterium]